MSFQRTADSVFVAVFFTLGLAVFALALLAVFLGAAAFLVVVLVVAFFVVGFLVLVFGFASFASFYTLVRSRFDIETGFPHLWSGLLFSRFSFLLRQLHGARGACGGCVSTVWASESGLALEL